MILNNTVHKIIILQANAELDLSVKILTAIIQVIVLIVGPSTEMM